MPDCLNHPGTPAESNCIVCGKAICKECIVSKKFCSERCAEAHKLACKNAERIKNYQQKPSGSWIRPAAVLLILVMLGFCAYRYYKRNHKKVETKINQVKSTGKSAVSNGREYLRKDSNYKKQRESQLK